MLKALLLFSFAFAAFAAGDDLLPFRTDYCTNYPEGTRDKPELWKHCCLIHDLFLWAGGSKQDRYDSDLELKKCVRKTGAYRSAKLMYLGVRMGFYSPVKYPRKKWSNGWRGRVNYRSLGPEEIDRIEGELSNGYEFIAPEIKTEFISKLRSRKR